MRCEKKAVLLYSGCIHDFNSIKKEKNMKRMYAVSMFLIFCCALGFAADDFAVQDNDRVVIWGDSITDNAYYPRSVENFVLSRFPEWTVEFHNLGWGW